VTNLYSSAIFIGWGAVVLGLVFERLHKNGIGAAAGSIVGFVTLIIAHHLGMGGDTMEMMQAVLDTNIWLATHVVVITLGYTAMFLAGILGIVFLIRGLVDSSFQKETARSMSSMVYGITCFAVLFSFVGTMLGGIWADQSWGRFWGWDPKENGALLIVIWSAIVLHARWGGLVRERGIMMLSIFGNIVTAWSWFGTNLLQEGLHAYGFSDAGFFWLVKVFVPSQILLLLIGALPKSIWRSPWAKSSISPPPAQA
jgi:ABC-type transport system involved in cytochrome c biogenesis permease subunit